MGSALEEPVREPVLGELTKFRRQIGRVRDGIHVGVAVRVLRKATRAIWGRESVVARFRIASIVHNWVELCVGIKRGGHIGLCIGGVWTSLHDRAIGNGRERMLGVKEDPQIVRQQAEVQWCMSGTYIHQ